MSTVIAILTILGVFLSTISLNVKFKDTDYGFLILGCGIGILFSMFIIVIIYSVSIPPMDVYRGKTTLEITYKDGIPIDSVVVYKNK